MGIASLPLPHAQQVAIVALDSQGYLHLYTTPLADSVVVWDPTTEPSTAPQERTGTGSVGSRGVVGEQQQEAAQPAAESGVWLLLTWSCVMALNASWIGTAKEA